MDEPTAGQSGLAKTPRAPTQQPGCFRFRYCRRAVRNRDVRAVTENEAVRAAVPNRGACSRYGEQRTGYSRFGRSTG